MYTYDVHWQPSQIKWASRWDAYLRMPGGKVGGVGAQGQADQTSSKSNGSLAVGPAPGERRERVANMHGLLLLTAAAHCRCRSLPLATAGCRCCSILLPADVFLLLVNVLEA